METRTLIEGTCPECRGPLTEVEDGEIVEFRCLVGHRYSPEVLLQSHYETEERALWAAVVSLEEAAKLVQAVVPHLAKRGANLGNIAEEKLAQAKVIRNLIEQLKPYPLP